MGKWYTLGLVAALAGPAVGQAPQPAYLSHPLGVKPEHGAYMICVKSYTGPQSQKLAETLAEHVRTVHQAAAYLFEYGGEQRAQEEAKQARARKLQMEKNAPFLQLQDQERQKAAAEGRPFIEQPVKLTVPKVTVPEQWAVLVGGFPTEEAARRALDVVKKWPPPAERLMDQQFSVGGENAAGTYINPFATALVVPSPAVKKGAGGPPPVDPALAKLNAEEPLSLLKSRKPYTLLVKAFSVKFVAKGKDEEPGMLDRLLGKGEESAKMLQATAHDARQMAEALRQPSFLQTAQADARKVGYALNPFEVFVLHTRTGSLVCVGEFNGEDDPDLIAAGRVLQEMTFEVRDRKDGPVLRKQRLFDNVIPLRVPR